jgi:mannose-6-phosphate isomerase-like protein (cupin superfamily)
MGGEIVEKVWGRYEVLEDFERARVKTLIISPGATMSYQMHYHRQELWVIVSGTLIVTVNDEDHTLTEGEWIDIPLGAYHSAHNPGWIDAEVVEVQIGSYIDENDIVRLVPSMPGKGKM